MTDEKTETERQSHTVDQILAQFLQAIFELFRPAPLSNPRLAARMRDEHEAARAAKDAILKRYVGAIWRADELERRAKAHGVVFAPAMRAEYRAAILDFLDNPDGPTPLTGMHMTWFWGADQNGRTTASRTHPVNRAVYRWNARDFAQMRPYGDAQSDAALHRLRTIHYPLDRCDWTTAQWAAHEKVGPFARHSEPTQIRPSPRTAQPSGSGVPTVL
jgi:hypothetical protein